MQYSTWECHQQSGNVLLMKNTSWLSCYETVAWRCIRCLVLMISVRKSVHDYRTSHWLSCANRGIYISDRRALSFMNQLSSWLRYSTYILGCFVFLSLWSIRHIGPTISFECVQLVFVSFASQVWSARNLMQQHLRLYSSSFIWWRLFTMYWLNIHTFCTSYLTAWYS